MECSPGGRLLMSSLILTPGAASVRVAVPMLCPVAFLMSITTGFGAAAAIELHKAAVPQASTALPTRTGRIFISFLPVRLWDFSDPSIFRVCSRGNPQRTCINLVTCGHSCNRGQQGPPPPPRKLVEGRVLGGY